MAGDDEKHLLRRGSRYYFYRRKPKDIEHVIGEGFVKISLKTDNLEIALRRKKVVNQQTEEYWESVARFGDPERDREKYESAVKMAQFMGYRYAEAEDLAENAPLHELVSRMADIKAAGITKEPVVAALAGGVKRPELNMTGALEEFFRLTRDWLTDKNDEQIRRWKNPRIKAVKNWVAVTKDPPLSKTDRHIALQFRDWWWDRIETEGLTVNSANKDFGHLHQIFDTVNEGQQLGLEDRLSRLRFKEKKKGKRPPYSVEFIRRHLLPKGKLAGLHPECQAMIFIIMNTGASPSELCGLLPEDIHLSSVIPYIDIKPHDGRSLKTAYRPRQIPLVGVALKAFKEIIPGGFVHYKDKPTQLSSNTNRHLTDNGLRETDDHSVYSLRHTFQDGLTRIECPDRIQADLMGHKFGRPEYGDGASLEQKRDWISRIAF